MQYHTQLVCQGGDQERYACGYRPRQVRASGCKIDVPMEKVMNGLVPRPTETNPTYGVPPVAVEMSISESGNFCKSSEYVSASTALAYIRGNDTESKNNLLEYDEKDKE